MNYNQIKNLFFLLFLTCNQHIYAQKPCVVFAHGLSQKNASFVQYLQPLFPESEYELRGGNGPEVLEHVGFNHELLCLGQEADIQVLINTCNEALTHGAEEIIGFGYSKGAVTWINLLHFLHQSNKETHKIILSKIKAAIVFAPFADCYDFEMFSNFAGRLKPAVQKLRTGDPFSLLRRTAGSILKKIYLPNFDLNGLFPIKAVASLPAVPLFIIHSTEDGLIPINHSRKLYLTAITSNPFLSLWFLEFDGGGHVDSMHANNEWHPAVHEFLKRKNSSDFNHQTYQPNPQLIAAQIKNSSPSFSPTSCIREVYNTYKSQTTKGL